MINVNVRNPLGVRETPRAEMASNMQTLNENPEPPVIIGASTMALETELATYQRNLPELKAHGGKFALVHGQELVGVYGTYEDALKAGYGLFSLNPFLVKQIQAVEQIQFITRLLDSPCHT